MGDAKSGTGDRQRGGGDGGVRTAVLRAAPGRRASVGGGRPAGL